MGIDGLLKALEPFAVDMHINKFAGQKVAVDAYCWLHKATYGCSVELCTNVPTTKYVTYCMEKVTMMRFFNVHPVLVFDGDSLPLKRAENDIRKRKREENLAKGKAKWQASEQCGKAEIETIREEARKYFRGAAKVTTQMAYELIKECKKQGVEFVVAPYEADAQLAYMARMGDVAAVVSEDSDILTYGAPVVLYKMDSCGDRGECKCIRLNDVLGHKKGNVDFTNVDHCTFVKVCILAGCDYLNSMPGFGFKKALAEINKFKTVERMFNVLSYGVKKQRLPDNYQRDFERAFLTFRHHFVYCKAAEAVIHSFPLSEPASSPKATAPTCIPETPSPAAQPSHRDVIDLDTDSHRDVTDGQTYSYMAASLEFLGTALPPQDARAICVLGTVDSRTKKSFSPIACATQTRAAPSAQRPSLFPYKPSQDPKGKGLPRKKNMGKPPDLFKQQARVGNMTATSKASNEYKRPKPTLAQIYQNEKQDEQTAMIYAAPTEMTPTLDTPKEALFLGKGSLPRQKVFSPTKTVSSTQGPTAETGFFSKMQSE